MKLRLVSAVLLACVLALAVLCSAGCGKKGAPKAGETPTEKPPIPVHVQPAALGTLDYNLPVSGTLQGPSEITLPAEANGVIRERLVDEGAVVAAGDPLLKIDDALLQRQLQAARADYQSADAMLSKAKNGARPEEVLMAENSLQKAQLRKDQAQSDFARAEQLFASGTISRQQRDDAETQVRLAEQDLASAQAALTMARQATRPEDLKLAEANRNSASARVAMYQTEIAKTVVKAPVGGTLVTFEGEVGEMASMGSPVAHLSAAGDFEIRVSLTDVQIQKLAVGQPINVMVPAVAGDKPLVGTLSYLAAAGDISSRLFEVRVTLPANTAQLRPGLVAQAIVPIDRASDVIVLPASAVLSPGSNAHVFVNVDGIAKEKPVQTGLQVDNQIAVLGGLVPGDQVIVVGQTELADGAKIAIVPEGDAVEPQSGTP
ncbi:MAG: efflux RND transporter periplasmic adaptor subunit [bacterium]